MSPIDQLAKLQAACTQQLSCVASETNEQGETERVHIVQADGVYLSCPAGVYPPLAQFAVWAANNTAAIVAERDAWKLLAHAVEATELTHSRSCGQPYDTDSPCTCGLQERINLATEQTMHAAWRKRAEEAEAERDALRERVKTLEGHLDFLGWESDGIARARQQLAERDAEIERLRKGMQSCCVACWDRIEHLAYPKENP